jgi:hypothetical protein
VHGSVPWNAKVHLMNTIQANVTGRAIPRLGLNPDESAAAAGVSRTRIFEAIRDGALTARKAGKATVIETDELRRWVRNLPTRGPRAKL